MDLIHTYTFRFKSLTHSAFNNIDLIGLSNLSPQLGSDKIRVSFSAAWCVETSHNTTNRFHSNLNVHQAIGDEKNKLFSHNESKYRQSTLESLSEFARFLRCWHRHCRLFPPPPPWNTTTSFILKFKQKREKKHLNNKKISFNRSSLLSIISNMSLTQCSLSLSCDEGESANCFNHRSKKKKKN